MERKGVSWEEDAAGPRPCHGSGRNRVPTGSAWEEGRSPCSRGARGRGLGGSFGEASREGTRLGLGSM